MASTTRRIIWLGNLLHSLGLKNLHPVEVLCDRNSAIRIAANPVFHEKTKHFELDVHLIRDKILVGVIKTVKVHKNCKAESVDKGQKKGFTKAKILEVLDSNSGERMSKICYISKLESLQVKGPESHFLKLFQDLWSENMAAILALGGSPSGMRREAELSRTVSLPVTPIAHSNPESMHVVPRSHSAPELLEAGDAHATLPTLDFTPVVVEADITRASENVL
ncbi:ribonuclease H-like domain-containing protein [Tanacetum coccineum]|uniref:Ribonuclease H-like domain-containing protein n=1 Tax=Tanacetum coccineum TaxID=301880 RepID=A0ABQ4WJJ2_9ASTR